MAFPHARTFAQVVGNPAITTRLPVDGGSASSTMVVGYDGGFASSSMVAGVDGSFVDTVLGASNGGSGRMLAHVFRSAGTGLTVNRSGLGSVVGVSSGRTTTVSQ